MKTNALILTVLLLIILSPPVSQSQEKLSDTTKKTISQYDLAFLSISAGYTLQTSIGFTYLKTSGFGVNVNYRRGFMPHNTSGDYHALLEPNKLKILSLNFVKEFSSGNYRIRYGVEVGPSYVYFSEKTDIEGSYAIFLLPIPTYDYREEVTHTAGLNARMKLSFPLVPGFGLETALVLNLNEARTILSIELALMFGKLRDKIRR